MDSALRVPLLGIRLGWTVSLPESALGDVLASGTRGYMSRGHRMGAKQIGLGPPGRNVGIDLCDRCRSPLIGDIFDIG